MTNRSEIASLDVEPSAARSLDDPLDRTDAGAAEDLASGGAAPAPLPAAETDAVLVAEDLGAVVLPSRQPDVYRTDHDRLFRVSVAFAFAIHVLVMAVLFARPQPEAAWSGSGAVDAIDIDIVASLGDLAVEGEADREAIASPPAVERPEPPPSAARIRDEAQDEPEPDRPQLQVSPEPPSPEPLSEAAGEANAPRDTTPVQTPPAEASTLLALPGVAIESGRPASETSLLSVKATAGEIEAYKRSIITALARRKPRVTGDRRGTVRIAFSIGPAGEVEGARVRQSSGRRELDEAALEAVRSTKFEVPPANMAADDLAYEIPYIFR